MKNEGSCLSVIVCKSDPEEELISALAHLQSIYRDPARSDGQRLRAAIAALPFESPKLAVTAVIGENDFASRLDRALARSGTKLIEAKASYD